MDKDGWYSFKEQMKLLAQKKKLQEKNIKWKKYKSKEKNNNTPENK